MLSCSRRLCAALTVLWTTTTAHSFAADFSHQQWEDQEDQIRRNNDEILRARGGGLPYYVAEDHCNRIAAVGGAPSETIRHECLIMEQKAYDAIKPAWLQLPEDLRLHCEKISAEGNLRSDGSYVTLQGCVDQELRAARSNDAFQFRR